MIFPNEARSLNLLKELLICINPTCAKGIAPITLINFTESFLGFRCSNCGFIYPIVDDIPLFCYPINSYIKQNITFCQANAERLQNLQLRLSRDDLYNEFVNIWLTRINEYNLEFTKIQSKLKNIEAQQTKSLTENFKIEYSKFETIEKYFKAAYGIYLNPMTGDQIIGNRESFYSTVLSAGKALPKDALVLDVGCGVGRTLLDYSLLCPDGWIFGIDYIWSNLKLSKQILNTLEPVPFLSKVSLGHHDIWKIQGFGRKNITLVAGSADNLPFKEATFDCVIGNYIFSIIDSYKTVFRKAAKLVKPGGMLLITNGFSWEDIREPERRHNPDDFNTIAESEGLKVEVSFDFVNIDTSRPRHFHMQNTRLTQFRKNL